MPSLAAVERAELHASDPAATRALAASASASASANAGASDGKADSADTGGSAGGHTNLALFDSAAVSSKQPP